MLTNREIATLAIFGLVAIWVAVSPALRRSGGGVMRAFFQWKIQRILLLYFTYVAFMVWIAGLFGVWTSAILKDTIIWTFITGFPILFRVTKVKDGKLLVRRTVTETLAVSAFIAFYVNLYSFSIPWEIVFQIAVTFLVMLELVARHQGATAKPVANFVSILLVSVGVFLIWITGSWLVDNWETLNHAEVGMSLALGLWLPIALIPFIYVLAYAMHCGSTLKMVRYFGERKRLKFGVAVGFFVGVRLSTKLAGRFTGNWRMRLAEVTNVREATAVMAEYRESLQSQEEKTRAAAKRLEDFAGVEGVDDAGRRLDRREFDETQRALKYLWNCMLGHSRNRNNKYREDLLPLLGNFSRHGLSANGDHGITMRVAQDQRSWYVWRRTITGWVFAIGGSQDDPIIEWLYDGADPPAQFPSKVNRLWANESADRNTSHNWN